MTVFRISLLITLCFIMGTLNGAGLAYILYWLFP